MIKTSCVNTRELLTPLPNVASVLSGLRSDGWRLGLVTNCSAETVTLWPETELARFITRPVFSCEVGLSKPDPRIFRLAASRLDVEAAQCVYVADGAGGELSGADGAGMAAIRVKAVGVDHATFGGYGDWNGPVIDDLTRLADRLQTYRQ